jgi:hypothetical protein
MTDVEAELTKTARRSNVADMRETKIPRTRITPSMYQDTAGHTITGKDIRGRSLKVFVPGDRTEAERVRANIRAGLPPFGVEKKYRVVCASHETKPLSREAAERKLAEIEKLHACFFLHTIELVKTDGD